LDSSIYNNNQLTETRNQIWDPNSAKWIDDGRQQYSYNAAGLLVEEVYQRRKNGAVENSFRQRINYKACGALPLTLLAFKAVKDKNFAKLIWKTANEIEVSHFIVEKNRGNKFEPIGTLSPLAGNTSVKSYNYSDDLLLLEVGEVLYRIKIVDIDGSFNYSNVERIKVGGSAMVSLFPNPVSRILQINGTRTLSLTLYNAIGTIQFSKAISSGNGNIDVSNFPAGAYWLKIQDLKGNIQVKKVIISR
jgi:hypothetical protein